MPKIPTFERTGPIQATPVVADRRNLGIRAGQIAGIAGVAADFFQELAIKRKRAEDNDYAFQRKMEDSRDLAAFEEQAKKTVPPEKYAEEIQGFVRKRFEQNQKNAPSETAKRIYQQESGGFFTRSVLEAQSFANVALREKEEKNISFQGEQSRIAQLSRPNIVRAKEDWQTQARMIKGSIGIHWSEQEADEMIRREANSYTRSLVNGFINLGRPEDAIKILTVEPIKFDPSNRSEMVSLPAEEAHKAGFISDEEFQKLRDSDDPFFRIAPAAPTPGIEEQAEISQFLSGDERARLLQQLKNAAARNQGSNITDLNAQVRDFEVRSLTSGSSIDSAETLISKIKANQSLTDQAKFRLVDQVYSSHIAGRASSALLTSPRSDWAGIIEQNANDLDSLVKETIALDPVLSKFEGEQNLSKREEHKRFLERVRQNALVTQNKDPQQYIVDNFPDVARLAETAQSGGPQAIQDYVNKTLSLQETLQIPKQFRRVSSKAQASAFASQIMNTPTAREAASAMSGFQAAYGDRFGDFMDEMIKDKVLPEGMRAAGWADSVTAKENIISNVKNRDAINENFKKSRENFDNNELIRTIESELADEKMAIVEAGRGADNLRQWNAIRDQVALQFRKANANNNELPSAETIRLAWEDTVGSSFHGVVQTGNSTVLVPRVVGGQPTSPKLVEAFIDAHSKAFDLRRLNIATPSNSEFSELKDPDLRFLEMLESRGRWVTNPRQDGLLLVFSDDSGSQQPVMTKGGSTLEIKFGEMNDPDTLLEASKGVFRKGLEFAIGRVRFPSEIRGQQSGP